MTHASTRPGAAARPIAPPRGDAVSAPAGPGAPPPIAAASLADRRRLADALAMPAECPREACRRAGRCRGPRGTSTAFPGEALPDCLASGFEALYRPVARWTSLMEAIAAAEARLASPDAG